MKYFSVWAETSVPVYSDGTPIMDSDCIYDNIRKYVVDECDEDGMVVNTKEYDIEHFDDIRAENQPPEWQNHDW